MNAAKLRTWLAALALATGLPAAHAQLIYLRGAQVLTQATEGNLPIGDILVRDDRILAVGPDLSDHPSVPSAQRVDVYGKVITPGLVLPWSRVGLTGSSAGERLDRSSRLGAAYRIGQAWNPREASTGAALAQGVTAAQIVPLREDSLFSGMGAVVSLDEEDAAVLARDNMVVVRLEQLGDSPQAAVQALGDALDGVLRYRRNRLTIERGGFFDFDMARADLDALGRVVEGEIPMFVEAHGELEIDLVLRLAQTRNIRLVIGGGREAWRSAPALAAASVPVILNPLDAKEGRARGGSAETWAAAGRLHEAGVTVLFGSDALDAPVEARMAAGLAVAWGMPDEAAMRALTIDAARTMGLPDRGQIAPGKIADLAIWSGDPLEMGSQVEQLMLSGVLRKPVDPAVQLPDLEALRAAR